MMRKGLRGILAACLCALLCVAANFAAFAIDTPSMREHAAQGVTMLGQQGGTPQLVGGFRSAQLDNYTAILILKTAAYTGPEPLLFKAFGGTRCDLPTEPGQDAWDAYCTYADGAQSPTGGLTYSRYWHSYTLPLRLLLCALDVANLQMLLYAAQGALFLAVALLMQRRRLTALIPAFASAFFLLMPAATGICIQYAPVVLLTLGFCALLLAFDRPMQAAIGLPGCFALAGLWTNALDLLTYPTATLVFPLVTVLALRIRRDDAPLRSLLAQSMLCCVAWGVGYGGMWALKWGINALVFGADRLAGVSEQIALRLSSASGGVQFSRASVLTDNLRVILAKPAYLLIIGLTLLALLGFACYRQRHGARPDLRALVLLVPALVGPIWLLALANHAYDHTYYTYRTLASTFYAFFALWVVNGHAARLTADCSPARK